jgi:hypothetical protein
MTFEHAGGDELADRPVDLLTGLERGVRASA